MSEEKKTIELIEPELVTDIVHSSGPTGIMENIESMSIERIEKILDKKAVVQIKLRNVALKHTSGDNWANMGKKPYATAPIIGKMVSLCGIHHKTISIVKTKSNDSMGEFYIYTATVEASHQWVGKVVSTGVATQRDQFFACKTVNKGTPNEEKVWKDSLDIPEASIIKKAETNAIGRAVRELLGLNDLTWQEVGKNAGINVTYGKNNNGAPPQQNGNGSEQKKPPDQARLKAMHDKLWKDCSMNDTIYSEVVRIVSNDFSGFRGVYDIRNITSEAWMNKFAGDYKKKKFDEWLSLAESALEKEPAGGK